MLLVHAGHLWTGKRLQTGFGLLCIGGEIRSIEPWETLRLQFPQAETVGGPGSLVLPGFVNAHHHGRGITSFAAGTCDECLEVWLAARSAEPPCDPYLDTLWAALGLLDGGFTSVALFQATRNPATALHEANERIRACRDAGLRVSLGLDLRQKNRHVYGPDPQGMAPLPGLSTDEYLAILQTLRTTWAFDPLVSVFAAPAGPQWVLDEAWEAIGLWTQEKSMPLHTHCLESPYQKEFARRAYGGSMVRYLHERGALHAHTSLVHGVWLEDDELDCMADAGASLVTNPSSNLRLRSGISPVLRARERGVNVALGTDGACLGDRDEALRELQLLMALHRPPGLAARVLDWEEALHAATAGAAAVTPWAGRVGSIAAGKLADLVIYDLEQVRRPWVHPQHHPVHVLAQRGGARHLQAVVVHGRVSWEREGGARLVDQAEVAGRLQAHMESQHLPGPSPSVERVRAHYATWDVPKRSS